MVGGMGDFYRERGGWGKGEIAEVRRTGEGGVRRQQQIPRYARNDRFSYTAARFCVLSELTEVNVEKRQAR